jgi:hypothetical protein
MRVSRNFVLALTCALALVPFGTANAAEPPAPNPASACARPFFATFDDRDAKAVVVRVIDLEGPFAGTITAYGADRMWTAKLERTALVDLPYGGREASVTVQADGPIEGVVYAPAWASCTFRAGTRPSMYYTAREVDHPVLTLGNPQPAAPATCARPYVPPVATRAVEPNTPVDAGPVSGTVSIAVALDERGVVRFTRVVASPAAELNVTAADAAKRSEYRAGIFRCEPVPSSYQYNIGYV